MKFAVKKLLKIFLCLLLLLSLTAAGWSLISRNYLLLNRRFYDRNLEQLSFYGKTVPNLDRLSQMQKLRKLDLRNTGLSLGEHEWLQRQLPHCEILWQVHLSGQDLYPDAREIQVDTLNESDIVTLDFLPELKQIDARNCKDYEVLAKLRKRRPECRILCEIPLGSRTWNQDARVLILKDADVSQVRCRLDALPRVKRILFTGNLPSTKEINLLRETFPEIDTGWKVELFGKTYSHRAEKLDLTLREIPDVQQLRKTLLYFPYLKTLDFRGTKFTEGDKKLLRKYYPQVEMLWDVVIDGVTVPMDTVQLDLSGHLGLQLEEIRSQLSYLPKLRKLILCDCGLPNQALSDFNESLKEISVVWNVQIGGRNTRTDETYFAPNKWGLKLNDRNIRDLKYCRDMVCVDIGHAKQVTNCQWAAFMPELKFLVLADTKVRGLEPLQNLKKLEFLELFLMPGQDLSPLKGCTALKDLNLCYLYADPAPIAEMTWLKRLWWTGCWPAKHLLENKLPDTEKNFHTGSSTGEGWREGKLYYEMRDFIGMGYMTG